VIGGLRVLGHVGPCALGPAGGDAPPGIRRLGWTVAAG
jgi:hypothetical protein